MFGLPEKKVGAVIKYVADFKLRYLPLGLSGVFLIVGVLVSSHTLLGECIINLTAHFIFSRYAVFSAVAESLRKFYNTFLKNTRADLTKFREFCITYDEIFIFGCILRRRTMADQLRTSGRITVEIIQCILKKRCIRSDTISRILYHI